MAFVALEGASIQVSTASGHVSYTIDIYESCKYLDQYGNCVGGYSPEARTTSASISGTCKSTSNNVYINSKKPILQNDATQESDSVSLPSGAYNVSGLHSSTSGRVTGGNTRNVYINGKLVSVIGASISTHAGTSSSINGGGSSNVNIG